MEPFGFLNINKPTGPTSHDIVAGVRRGIAQRRVGHAGTLDPLANGVLVVAVGNATRLLEYVSGHPKTYRAVIELGVTTDTYDSEGEIVSRYAEVPAFSIDEIQAVLANFTGEIQQIPPVYSAIKVRGKSAHARVRAGEDVQLQPRRVTVRALSLVDMKMPELAIEVTCSAGTYIRSLAHDIGNKLGTGAIMTALTRLASGSFALEDAVNWDTLQQAFLKKEWYHALIPVSKALEHLPAIYVKERDVGRVVNGMPIQSDDVSSTLARAYTADGRFFAIVEGDKALHLWRPKKVFANQLDDC